MPFVSIIIPHYQDLAGLDLCLSTLKAQTYPADQFEIIVSDNNSPCGFDAVRQVVNGRARLVSCDEKGAGPNRNAAVAASKGEILAFIDSDCQADPEWTAAGVAAVRPGNVVGGKVRVLVEDPANMTPAEAFETVFAFDFETYIRKKGFTGAGNMFCSRTVWERVGGFSNRVSEDVDWSHRARACGFDIVYAPDAVVGHPARRTWSELELKWRRLNRETYLLERSKGRSDLHWLLRASALPISAVLHSPRVFRASQLPRFRDKAKALGMLYALRLWRMGNACQLLVARPS